MTMLRRHLGWLLIVVVCLAPVPLWAAALTPGALSSAAGAMRHTGLLFGYVGFTAYAVNLVLASRGKLLDRLFGGLDRLYRVHRRLGTAVPVLLVVHAYLIVAAMSAPSIPVAFGVLFFDLGWRVLLGLLALTLLISAVVVSQRVPLLHETFVYVQRFMGAVFGLGALHALLVPGLKVVSPAVRAYLLAVAAVGGVAYLYRGAFGRFVVPRRRYRVTDVRRLDPSTAEIVMVPRGRPLRHRAGQFAFFTFRCGGIPPEPHPFSIASAPGAEKLRIVVKALGDFTAELVELSAPCEVLVEGAYGRFSHTTVPRRRQVWIAGGIGITPFLSMARSLDRQDLEIDLYYCTETKEESHFLEELDQIADEHLRMRVIPIRRFSLGFITADDIEGATRDVAHKDVLICGPPAMMRNLRRQFRGMGVPRSRLHYEDFGFFG